MGRKQGSMGTLGRALVKDRFGRTGRSRAAGSAESEIKHTTLDDDTSDIRAKKIQSVVEHNDLDEFLEITDLAGTDFHAEKESAFVVDISSKTVLHRSIEDLSEAELQKLKDKEAERLRIPRRPAWDQKTSPEELERKEREGFLDWRRTLAQVEEDESLVLTPFEKNLEFWKQLWRVLERSDIVVEIVDARNPLLFHCPDLFKYAKEISPKKTTMILVNKSDLLTHRQRIRWAKYFEREGVKVHFWSAHAEKLKLEEVIKIQRDAEALEQLEAQIRARQPTPMDGDSESDSDDDDDDDDDDNHNATNKDTTPDTENKEDSKAMNSTESEPVIHAKDIKKELGELWTREELLAMFEDLVPVEQRLLYQHKGTARVTVGMVGFPNVGKSSTINVLCGTKKVSVSATPGKTKHFQTLLVTDRICLCDCPGLVFPSLAHTKADLICNGILPIDQMRDARSPTELVCQRVGRNVLEHLYGFTLPSPSSSDYIPGRAGPPPPTARDLLQTYARMRSFFSHSGVPDESRSARIILKDYVNGRILYSHPPPDGSGEWHADELRRDDAADIEPLAPTHDDEDGATQASQAQAQAQDASSAAFTPRNAGLNIGAPRPPTSHKQVRKGGTKHIGARSVSAEVGDPFLHEVQACTKGKFASKGFTRKANVSTL
eukprot:TRINITY_DN11470_c0_g1::TRINITY_DN11470_c0_g1_i1::g.10864::m.10864 TRINITY_DN11470_c0_g1::TRINITY_DN11470_c0_g1_i1::g.10864  ORF type:complete len:661 (+),score=158.79,sp/Q6NY89/LSG1_DANRE/44.43/3e-146,MMR_HSR1/PF01926.18/2.8e+02,MMR_HSR1/PF01926.18/56,MMR_HSR1/PF01926.18/2.7e-13,FeoB_N/PF02421.13/41,FeoB_N/PF02421.13/0.0001,DUF258/PF03193.11/0.0018,Sporozoite_P67/PF05642.6/0.0021,CDC45/PF02724.9/0.0046,Miro/PF08477.8/2.6e+02,Miro/PF08477.8/8.8e+03,Miro/PF08477.8/1.8,Vfa1/PF08432.5/5.8,DUF4611/PF